MNVLRGFLAGSLLLMVASPSLSALVDATSALAWRCVADRGSLIVPEEAFGSCNENLNQVAASASVKTSFGGLFPEVGRVEASASQTRGEVVGAASRTNASASVTYAFSVEQSAPPPFQPATMPLLFQANGEVGMSTDGALGSSNALAGVLGVTGALVEVTIRGSGAASFSDSLPLTLQVGIPYSVIVGAGCEVFLDSPNTAGNCTAMADPSLSFDQTTFDDMYANPFALVDFYEIAYSPNVSFQLPPPSIPEPTTLLLLGSGIAIMRVLSRRSLPGPMPAG